MRMAAKGGTEDMVVVIFLHFSSRLLKDINSHVDVLPTPPSLIDLWF